MSDPQNVMIVPLPKQETPAAPAQADQGNRIPDAIPYSRFHEVVEQKNALAAKAAQLEQVLGQINSTVNPNQTPQFQTAEELVRYTKEEASKETQRLIQDAVKQYIEPLQQKEALNAYGTGVERYFASDPQAASIRNEMDEVTRVLPEWKKQQIFQSVMYGDYDMLNALKAQVLQRRQTQTQGQVSQGMRAEVPLAQAPQPFKTLGVIPQTQEDKIAEARKTNNWSDVFNSLPPLQK